jgi:hypothetical protein
VVAKIKREAAGVPLLRLLFSSRCCRYPPGLSFATSSLIESKRRVVRVQGRVAQATRFTGDPALLAAWSVSRGNSFTKIGLAPRAKLQGHPRFRGERRQHGSFPSPQRRRWRCGLAEKRRADARRLLPGMNGISIMADAGGAVSGDKKAREEALKWGEGAGGAAGAPPIKKPKKTEADDLLYDPSRSHKPP